jgi:DNA-binding response OmpR family regulator
LITPVLPRKRNIAIVDDEPSLGMLYSLILRKQGYQVVFVGTSGEEIIEAIDRGELRKDNLDIVALDYRLGNDKLNGLETAVKIKEHIPTARIVIITADTTIKTQAVAAGLSYISKQFSVEEFLDVVGEERGEGKQVPEGGESNLQSNVACTS